MQGPSPSQVMTVPMGPYLYSVLIYSVYLIIILITRCLCQARGPPGLLGHRGLLTITAAISRCLRVKGNVNNVLLLHFLAEQEKFSSVSPN